MSCDMTSPLVSSRVELRASLSSRRDLDEALSARLCVALLRASPEDLNQWERPRFDQAPRA